MKYVLISLVSFLIMSCVPKPAFNGNEADKDAIIKFSKHVQKVISLGQKDHFLKHVDPSYLKEQLTDNLSGDTTKFLNEFFCGKSDSTFHCMNFESIMKIHLLEVTDTKNNSYQVKYKIEDDNKFAITSEVSMVKRDSNYYLVSAVG